MTEIIIVKKTGELQSNVVKNLKVEEVYKKCGFRKALDFKQIHTWKTPTKIDDTIFWVTLFARDDGKANNENKYDLPPPIDSSLYFGNMALVAHSEKDCQDDNIIDLSIQNWEVFYEKLFGGFEDLNQTKESDENEIDELANVPNEMKTKNGYLKDGFVVDSEEDDNSHSNHTTEEEDEDEFSDELDGSELDFEDYEYQEQ